MTCFSLAFPHRNMKRGERMMMMRDERHGTPTLSHVIPFLFLTNTKTVRTTRYIIYILRLNTLCAKYIAQQQLFVRLLTTILSTSVLNYKYFPPKLNRVAHFSSGSSTKKTAYYFYHQLNILFTYKCARNRSHNDNF